MTLAGLLQQISRHMAKLRFTTHKRQQALFTQVTLLPSPQQTVQSCSAVAVTPAQTFAQDSQFFPTQELSQELSPFTDTVCNAKNPDSIGLFGVVDRLCRS
jgi:hypothetical protein